MSRCKYDWLYLCRMQYSFLGPKETSLIWTHGWLLEAGLRCEKCLVSWREVRCLTVKHRERGEKRPLWQLCWPCRGLVEAGAFDSVCHCGGQESRRDKGAPTVSFALGALLTLLSALSWAPLAALGIPAKPHFKLSVCHLCICLSYLTVLLWDD